ncbi:hypothetical protein DFJ74DRAFT_657914 [Hyaloraphidium curvatum]|nr:hypothetical protein DFJ74DRAFT_657914 [Hyaloraphidium curvatum]
MATLASELQGHYEAGLKKYVNLSVEYIDAVRELQLDQARQKQAGGLAAPEPERRKSWTNIFQKKKASPAEAAAAAEQKLAECMSDIFEVPQVLDETELRLRRGYYAMSKDLDGWKARLADLDQAVAAIAAYQAAAAKGDQATAAKELEKARKPFGPTAPADPEQLHQALLAQQTAARANLAGLEVRCADAKTQMFQRRRFVLEARLNAGDRQMLVDRRNKIEMQNIASLPLQMLPGMIGR